MIDTLEPYPPYKDSGVPVPGSARQAPSTTRPASGWATRSTPTGTFTRKGSAHSGGDPGASLGGGEGGGGVVGEILGGITHD